MTNNIKLLQSLIEKNHLDAVIITSSDEYNSEYTAGYAKRLQFLTGFSGSNGTLLLTKSRKILFTDGRYLLQAKLETQGLEIMDLTKCSVINFISENLKDHVITLNPWLHTESEIIEYNKKNININLFEQNLVDEIWEGQEERPNSQIFSVEEFAGKKSSVKIAELIGIMDADAILLTSSASICWLLNIRASDIPYNPVMLGYLILLRDYSYHLFRKNDGLFEMLDSLAGKKIILDPRKTQSIFTKYLEEKNIQIIRRDDPVDLPKACKNKVEVANARIAHLRDGAALCKFMHFFANNKEVLSEYQVAEKLYEFRSSGQDFVTESFAPIVGFCENSSVIHYHPNARDSKLIEGNGVLLIDSGGQYLQGTTDVTRVIAVGDVLGDDIRKYTLVLKAHIALATIIFPRKTNGAQLDGITRANLWREMMDYPHGTGHGVGSFLNVHEGPQSISKRNLIDIEPGMIISNEPGYYQEGASGFRIENLMVVEEYKDGFLKFSNLTMVPYEERLIDRSMLTPSEIAYIDAYHREVYANLAELVDEDVREFLRKVCLG